MQEPAWGAGTVTTCTEMNLGAALAGGGRVTFACDGVITLGNLVSITTNTALDGSGHKITISGNNAVGVIAVAPSVSFVLTNLTIAAGFSSSGAGIFNNGGIVTAVDCFFVGNRAQGSNGGEGSSGQTAYGGAIYNAGWLTAINCVFDSNSATGGSGYDASRVVRMVDGAWGGPGGQAGGAAICNWGQSLIQCSLFVSNLAFGGAGGGGGNGGPGSGDTPGNGGNGGAGADGAGGAVFNGGTISLVNCTVVGNSGIGGTGGKPGLGGQLWYDGYLIHGIAGGRGSGGNGVGAVCSSNAACFCTNCTIANNSSSGGTPNGIASGTFGFAGGTALNCILAFNAPSNCFVTPTAAGHNISSDASCAFTGSGSMTNTDPKLGLLANNGGPTLTMALLPGSPAIDAGSAAGAPATDQRGVARPQGPGVDIGAFEFQYIPMFMGMSIQNATNCCLQMAGLLPNQTFTLQVSSNLLNWSAVTNFSGTNGFVQYVDPTVCKAGKRFYRVKSAAP